MSIKLRLTLFNTLFMSILVVLVLFLMIFASDSIINATTKAQLRDVVWDNLDEIDYEKDGKLDLDDIEFYEDQVTTILYNMEGEVMAGNLNNLELFTMPLIHDNLHEEVIDGKTFLVYDLLYEYKGEPMIFVRGITSTEAVSATIHGVFFMAFIFFPLFILISSLGSYIISKKSLKPLDQMIQTASEITHSDDLSRRIGLSLGNQDEIHALAYTFDEMFGRLEQSFLQEKQFSSDVSHELRTPTAVILAECQCMLEGDPTLEEQTEALTVIQRQGHKMETIIRNLLALIRLENGVEQLHFDKVDLSELVSIVCEEQEMLLPETAQLKENITDGIFITGDYSMLIRVLSNLIDNGFHYGKEGGFVEVSLSTHEKTAILTVKDDGIGIAQESISKIWQRFYQVDSARSSDGSGSMGLGLSMVAQLVKLHGGSIDVESELGVGSVFTVKLPLLEG